LNSNASAGVKDTIRFAIGSGLKTIAPKSALPTITDPVILDGRTQPGGGAAPRIELNGSNAGAASAGLVVSAGNSQIKGLTINRFGGAGIVLQSKGGDL